MFIKWTSDPDAKMYLHVLALTQYDPLGGFSQPASTGPVADGVMAQAVPEHSLRVYVELRQPLQTASVGVEGHVQLPVGQEACKGCAFGVSIPL